MDEFDEYERLPDLNHIRDHVIGIMEAFYETGDPMKLEASLDEVCYELDIPMKKGDPVMQKKRNLMREYLDEQKKHIDKMFGRTR